MFIIVYTISMSESTESVDTADTAARLKRLGSPLDREAEQNKRTNMETGLDGSFREETGGLTGAYSSHSQNH